MGRAYGAICKSCGHRFEVNRGGGFFFHMLHCDVCGKEKSVSFDKLGDAHLRYLKGHPGPHSVATRPVDKYVREHFADGPLTEEEYHAIVEEIAGDHACGGHFCMDAPPRCPKCRCADLREDPDAPVVNYD